VSGASWEEALFVDRAAPDRDAPVSPFVALQRVVVRMLFDPVFVARVYDDTAGALAGLDLDAGLVAQLLENDRRLWNADRLRRSRALRILMDEFKVSATLVLRERRRLDWLDAFFGSPEFHSAVQSRDYMALAFVAFLERGFADGSLRSPELSAVLELEAEMARSRRELRDARRGHDRALRAVESGAAGRRVVAGPGVRDICLPGGVLEIVQHIEKYLFELSLVPALALCEDVPVPDPLPALRTDVADCWLFEPRRGGKVELSCISGAVSRVINACGRPVSVDLLASALAGDALDREEVTDLAAQLVDAGVLREVDVDDRGAVRAIAVAG